MASMLPHQAQAAAGTDKRRLKNDREKNERAALGLICSKMYKAGNSPVELEQVMTFQAFLTLMRSQGSNAPFIFLEETVTYKERNEAVAVGCLRYVAFNPDRLLAACPGRLSSDEVETFRAYIPLAQGRACVCLQCGLLGSTKRVSQFKNHPCVKSKLKQCESATDLQQNKENDATLVGAVGEARATCQKAQDKRQALVSGVTIPAGVSGLCASKVLCTTNHLHPPGKDCDSNAGLSHDHLHKRARVNINEAAASPLTGCCVQRLQTKPPSLLQTIATSASGSQQLQQPMSRTVPDPSPPAPAATPSGPMAAAAAAVAAAAAAAASTPTPSFLAAQAHPAALAAAAASPSAEVDSTTVPAAAECATAAAAAGGGGGGGGSLLTLTPQSAHLANQSMLVDDQERHDIIEPSAADKLVIGKAEQSVSAVAQQRCHDLLNLKDCQNARAEHRPQNRLFQNDEPGSMLRSDVMLSGQSTASLHQRTISQQHAAMIIIPSGNTRPRSTWRPTATEVPGTQRSAEAADCFAPCMQTGALTAALGVGDTLTAKSVAATAAAHTPPSPTPSPGSQPRPHKPAGVSEKLPALPAAASPVSDRHLGVQPGGNAAQVENPVIKSSSEDGQHVQVDQHQRQQQKQLVQVKQQQQQQQRPVVQVKQEQQQQQCRARLPQTGPLAATTAGCAAVASGQGEQQQLLPSGCTLTDCGDDILAAGRQLTRLLDLLQASDQQMVQLNACINSLCECDQSHQSRVSRFWFDYSQLQVWVSRKNVQELWSAVQQLLLNASKKWGS